MFVNFTPINFQNKSFQNIPKQQNIKYPNLAPLKHDTVSFGAMKKSEFVGIDLAVVQKFQAPIEKFNSNDDLQKWAGYKAEAITENDFGGRHEETEIQRNAMLKEWSDYVLYENNAYKKTTALLILNAITKDLESDNDNLPPVLNKGVLADCIDEIDKNTKNNPKYQFDLNKMYQNKLRAFYIDDIETDTGETATKWIIIPSAKHDPKNFKANVEKLKALSYKTWCTKSFNAEPYLWQGDFHIYLENGKPKLGVRFIGDEIEEIQGELNNSRIPVNYFDVIQNHISENNLKLTEDAKDEIKSAQTAKTEIKKIKKDLKEAIKNNDIKKIYNYFGIDAKEGKTGYLTISEYKQPSKDYTFQDLGIDENILIEKVKTIKGNANFRNSMLTDLKNLKYINGNASFWHSQVTNLGNLKIIGGNANFKYSKVTNLGNLETIGGDADFTNSQVTDLGNLQTIGRNAYFNYSQITNLANLEIIGGNADFRNSQITDFGNLEEIGGNACFYASQVTNLGNLETIGGDADFYDSQITDLGNLEKIEGKAYFNYSQVTDLGNLEKIGEGVVFNDSQVTDLGNLEKIGGEVYIKNSPLTVEDFKNIKIGGQISTK